MEDLQIPEHSSLEVFSEILKHIHEGVIVLDGRNTVQLVNDSAVKILGYPSREDLVGRSAGELKVDNEDVARLFDCLSRRLGDDCGGTQADLDGYTYKGLYSVRQLKGLGGRTIVVLHDIRHTNKAAESFVQHTRELELANKELDQFAYIVSHDLKAPLRAISNLSSWLEEDLGDSLSGENRDMLATLRSRVQRMESLINGVLEYSKVGKTRIPDETIDVSKLVAAVIELLGPPPHVSIQIDRMPLLEAPRTMLHQIFSNLLSNAIKYNDKSRCIIRIYARDFPDHFEFVVEDNGPGIPPESHEKIFLIFQTLRSRDKFESTGIGLTIVRRILEARGGEIRVESTPGSGSRFIFTWPK